MADLGLVEVDTPTGRILVPRKDAALYGLPMPPMPATPEEAQAAIANAPASDELAPAPAAFADTPPTVSPVPAIAPSLMPVQSAPAHADPDLAPDPFAQPAAPAAARAPAPAPKPEPVPDLSKATYGDLYARQQADLKAEQAAQQRVGEAEAKVLDEEAAFLERRNIAVAAKEKENAEKTAAEEAELDKKAKVWEAKNQEFMNAKVTRRKINSMELLGAVMSGLGNVLNKQGGPNPALQLAMQKIDQDVADQERERDQLGRAAHSLKGGLDYAREVATNRQAQRLAAVGLQAQALGREWQATSAKMASGVKREQLALAGAQLAKEGTAAYGQAMQLQHAEDQQKAQLQQAERASRRSAFVTMRGQDLDRENSERAFEASIAKVNEERAARVATAKTAADKEAASRELPDLFTQSKDVDGKPVRDVYRARDKEAGDRIALIKAARDQIDENVQEILRIRNDYKSFAAFQNSPDFQKLNTLLTDSGIAYTKLYQMGAYDKGTAEATNRLWGGDPLSGSYAKDVAAQLWKNTDASAGLQKAREVINRKFNAEANASRDPRGGAYIPLELKSAVLSKPIKTKEDARFEKVIAAKTPAEMRAAAEPGVVAGTMAASNELFGGERLKTNAQVNADDKAFSAQDATGRVAKEQAAAIEKFAANLSSSDANVAMEARKSLVGIATLQDRPQLAQFAIDKLADAGDATGLAEVEAKLTQGAKSEREIEERRAPVRIAMTAAMNRAEYGVEPSVGVLVDRAGAGDFDAVNKLMKIQYDVNSSPADVLAAEKGIAAFAAARKKKK